MAMTKLSLWTDLMSTVPKAVKHNLEHFLTFSELGTGNSLDAEDRLSRNTLKQHCKATLRQLKQKRAATGSPSRHI